MPVEISEERIDNEHLPEHCDRPRYIDELRIVAKHLHDVRVFVLIPFLILVERALAHIVERDELFARAYEALAGNHVLALECAEEGLLGIESKQLEDMRAEVFGNVVVPHAERRAFAKFEHVVTEGSVAVGNKDGFLALRASVVYPAALIEGEIDQFHVSMLSLTIDFYFDSIERLSRIVKIQIYR